VSRYGCVDDQRAAGFPVTAACEAVGVSTSAYYERCQRQAVGPSERQLAEAELVVLIREIYAESDGNYGAPRMTVELRHRGQVVNRKRVRRLMRRHGLAGRHHRRVRTTIAGEHYGDLPDLVNRAFDPGAPDVAWVGDITYIPTGEGWLYLASMLDLGSRRLLGYSMAAHMRTELVADALQMAIDARGGEVAGVITHSDRGTQYTSNAYRDLCQAHQLRQSVGRTGSCFDNAVAESFWASLKREIIDGRGYATRADARRAIFAWINWYNTRRLHTSLGSVPPITWEQCYSEQAA
jgi:putative transposase